MYKLHESRYDIFIAAQTVENRLLLKPHSEIYHQHHLKHLPCRQGVNIFVSVSVQLH